MNSDVERDREDFEILLRTAHEGRERGTQHFSHLDQPVGIWNYIRIANEIADLVPRGRLLDWGCGLGQMSFLLRRRGFEVVSYDIAVTAEALPDLPLTRDLQVIVGNHPTQLPFGDASFDVVLSCGVLEHVDEYSGEKGNEIRSLQEIHRVLKPGGFFPIYQLPQQHTWQEAIVRRLELGYAHPRRFTEGEIRRILANTGFRVERLRRYNMLPKNLTAMPGVVRTVYSRFTGVVMALDRALSNVPILNRIAGVMEVVARRN